MEIRCPRRTVTNIQHKKRHNVSSREKAMARDLSDFAQHSSERAMQAANFGMNWSREFAEQTFGQSRQAVDAFLRVTRKMAEDFESQATVVREHMTSLTQKTSIEHDGLRRETVTRQRTAGVRTVSKRVLGSSGADYCGPDQGIQPEVSEGGTAFCQQRFECDGRSNPKERRGGVNIASRAEQASKRRAEA